MQIYTVKMNAGVMTKTLDITKLIRDIVDIIEESLKVRLAEDMNWLSKLAKDSPDDCVYRPYHKRYK